MTQQEASPNLRSDIQIVPVKYQNTTVFLVQDYLRLVPEGTVLQQASLNLLALMTRAETISELQLELTRLQNGMLISRDEILEIIHQFDELFILDTPVFRRRKMEIVRNFRESSVRKPVLAGTAYPENPEMLKRFLGRFMNGNLTKPSTQATGGKIKALIIPHIDLKVGGDVYGEVYRYWPETPPKRILFLGTGHYLRDGFFSVTSKSYETPLGELPVHEQAVKSLQSIVSSALSSDDFAHRFEHSLELQALFIRYLCPDCHIACIPVLCGSFTPLFSVKKPGDYLAVAPFLSVLKEIAADPETLIVVSVDLSHIGPKFGHPKPARRMASKAEKFDKSALKYLVKGDLEKFWELAVKHEDYFNVCGLSSLATLLEICPGLEGEVLNYKMWFEEETHSAVSFAGVILREPTRH